MNQRPAGEFAPVAIFAFNRLDPLRETLAALEKAAHFGATPLFVFSEAARPHLADEAAEVERVRDWLRPWCLAHNAVYSEAHANRGLRRSIVSGVEHVLARHNRVIVLEDDVIVSHSFLRFMNDSLHAHETNEEIMQVSGWFVPHDRSLPPTGLLRVPGSWGWATWSRAWAHYCDDAAFLVDAVRKADARAFDINDSYGFLLALEKNAAGELDTWAVRWYGSMFTRGGMAVYPARSLVRNIGFGADGTNCGPGTAAGLYMEQRVSDEPVAVERYSRCVESAEYAAALEEFYRLQQWLWTRPSLRDRIAARVKMLARPIMDRVVW